MINWILAALNSWRRLTEVAEATLLDNISATVPWLAPIMPAFFVYDGLLRGSLVPPFLAIIAGVVTEFLGLATISTVVQFWDYNGYSAHLEINELGKRKGSKKQRLPRKTYRAPVLPAGLAAGYYLVVIIVINVLLDGNSNSIEKVVKALLSTMSIVGALTLALRSQHARQIAEIRTKKEAVSIARKMKLSERKAVKVSESFTPPPTMEIKSGRTDWRHLPAEDRSLIAKMTPREIMDKYGIDERSAYNWLARARSSERQPEK